MRYSAEHKKETRSRILGAAGRLFRKEGFGGSGIDGLTKAAGVTNGAFYGHFKTKNEAFKTVVLDGMEELRSAVSSLRAEKGADWFDTFVDFYLGTKRTCDMGESCALPSLSPEVIRADTDIRLAYQAVFEQIVDEVSDGLSGDDSRERKDKALALLVMLSGAVTLARAVPDPTLSDQIAQSVRRFAAQLK